MTMTTNYSIIIKITRLNHTEVASHCLWQTVVHKGLLGYPIFSLFLHKLSWTLSYFCTSFLSFSSTKSDTEEQKVKKDRKEMHMGWSVWRQWMGGVDGGNGWRKWMGGVDEGSGWVEWMKEVDGWSG